MQTDPLVHPSGSVCISTRKFGAFEVFELPRFQLLLSCVRFGQGSQQRVVRDRSFNGIRFDTVSQDHLPATAAIEPDGNGNHHFATIPANGDLAIRHRERGFKSLGAEIILKWLVGSAVPRLKTLAQRAKA